MKKNKYLFIAGGLAFVLGVIVSYFHHVLAMLFCSLMFFFIFYFNYKKKNIIRYFICSIPFMIAFVVFLGCNLKVAVIFIPVQVFFFYCLRKYMLYYDKKLEEVIKRKESLVEKQSSFAKKAEARKESLKTLEKRVDDIFKLLELAKYLNETLSYNEILKILSDRVFYVLPFKIGNLFIIDEVDGIVKIERLFKLTDMGWEDESSSNMGNYTLFAEYILNVKKNIVIENADELSEYGDFISPLYYPFWFFPLIVDDKIVAVLTVEGADRDDYSKFAIVAVHLALQIKKVKLYNTIKELAIRDGLTGVYLRRHFLDRFSEELKRSIRNNYPLSILMLDVDNFKKYNDNYGHLVGDATLKKVAGIMINVLRKVDLICRYGGEEFVVLLPETDMKGAVDAAERIRKAVESTVFRIYDELTDITVSIGVSSFPENCKNTENFSEDLILELLQKADRALYIAKENGRNRVVAAQ